jgi:RND family efflux transporter MFP subunit
MPAKRFIHPQLERRFSMETEQDITSATRLHLCSGRLIVVALILWLPSCNSQHPAADTPPPPEVTVSKPEQKEVANWDEFTGQTSAVNLVNISARVSGYIVNIPFKEGDTVHKGDLLYQIDPRPYQATYNQAIGQLKVGQANQQYQDATFNRNAKLSKTGVISSEDYDQALSNKAQADAQLVAEQASVESAKLNLDFTRVTSPIDGRVGRQLVNIGNLVQADSTQLTTVVSIDPMYAYFSVDELAAMKYQRLARDGKLATYQHANVPVYLQLQDEIGFPHEGSIDFANNSFDSSTGTILIRGSFPNQDGFLTPGAFVRVRVASSAKFEALLVADRAIGSDQGQSYVYVIDSKNVVAMRRITTGQIVDGLRVVESGLNADDVVIINGILKAQPGNPVKPIKGSMEQFVSNDTLLSVSTVKESPSPGGTNETKNRN